MWSEYTRWRPSLESPFLRQGLEICGPAEAAKEATVLGVQVGREVRVVLCSRSNQSKRSLKFTRNPLLTNSLENRKVKCWVNLASAVADEAAPVVRAALEVLVVVDQVDSAPATFSEAHS